MDLRSIIKRSLLYIVKGIPNVHTTANICLLNRNELLKGRNALITGGTSGIGYAIATSFVNSGASVCITGRDEGRIATACEVIRKCSLGGVVQGIVLDNREVDCFEEKLHLASEMMGGKIDILVNNAGVLGCDFSHGSPAEFDNVLDTNLRAVFFLSQAMGHYMKNKNIKGNILNIASSSSLRPAVSAYTLSKWGVRGLTLGMAKSLAPYGITVNGLAPGQTATPMLNKTKDNIYNATNPLGRYILPEEIANATVFLVSDMGRAIMGDILYMTGGSGVFDNSDMDYSF